LIIQIVIVRHIYHGQHFFVAKFHHLAINKGGCDSYKGFFGEKIIQIQGKNLRFRPCLLVCCQNILRFQFFFFFSLTYSQIWLSIFINRIVGFFTNKFIRKNLIWTCEKNITLSFWISQFRHVHYD
jgi:hypothetical protein